MSKPRTLDTLGKFQTLLGISHLVPSSSRHWILWCKYFHKIQFSANTSFFAEVGDEFDEFVSLIGAFVLHGARANNKLTEMTFTFSRYANTKASVMSPSIVVRSDGGFVFYLFRVTPKKNKTGNSMEVFNCLRYIEWLHSASLALTQVFHNCARKIPSVQTPSVHLKSDEDQMSTIQFAILHKL